MPGCKVLYSLQLFAQTGNLGICRGNIFERRFGQKFALFKLLYLLLQSSDDARRLVSVVCCRIHRGHQFLGLLPGLLRDAVHLCLRIGCLLLRFALLLDGSRQQFILPTQWSQLRLVGNSLDGKSSHQTAEVGHKPRAGRFVDDGFLPGKVVAEFAFEFFERVALGHLVDHLLLLDTGICKGRTQGDDCRNNESNG